MKLLKIKTYFDNLTPGMTLKKYAKQVIYHGEDCGYIEEAGKRKYVLTPAINKLEHKLALNNFSPSEARYISHNEFNIFKILLKPFVRNERGLKKLNLINKNLYYSPSPASILVWDKQTNEPIVTIIKKLNSPTQNILLHRLEFFRKWFRISPYK